MRAILLGLILCSVLLSNPISYSATVIGGEQVTEPLYTSRQAECTKSDVFVSARPAISSVGLVGIDPASKETTLRDLNGTNIKQKWEIKLIDDRQFSSDAKQCCELALAGYREWVQLKEKPQSFDIFKPFNECMLNKSLIELERTSVYPSSFYIGLSYTYSRGVLGGKFRVKKAETSFYEFLRDLDSCCEELRNTEAVASQTTKPTADSSGWTMQSTYTSIKDFANTLRKCMINRRYDAEEIK